jgi:hypothetical protein
MLSQGSCVPEGNGSRTAPSRNWHISQEVLRRTFGTLGIDLYELERKSSLDQKCAD